jgi:hypothetical protein
MQRTMHARSLATLFVLLFAISSLPAADAGTNTLVMPPPLKKVDGVIATSFYVLFCLYLVQALFAFLKAGSKTEPGGSLLTALVTREGLSNLWSFLVIAIILSIGIPIAQQIASPTKMAEGTKEAIVTYNLTTGCLLVFITLEVSCLYDMLQTKSFDWLSLLLVSLVVDLIAFFLLTRVGEPTPESSLPANKFTTTYMLLTMGTALISSASTILFARTQGLLVRK